MAKGEQSIRFRIPPKRKSDSARLETAQERIEIGTGGSCPLKIEDPIASERHCELSFQGGKFTVQDLESSTGTYLDGIPVQSVTEITSGSSLVIGATRIAFKVVGEAGDETLEMSLSEKSFYFVEKGKGAKLADLYQWVRSEVVFGRSSALTWGNILIGILTVGLMGLAFVGGVRKPLVDPGELHGSHAMLFAQDWTDEDSAALERLYPGALGMIEKQGCSVCHDPFRGAPASKCAQCHGDILTEQHPAISEEIDPEAYWAETGCVQCHLDHTREGAWDFVPSIEETISSCNECHEDQVATVAAKPITKDRKTLVNYDAFSHEDHLGGETGGETVVACSLCHVRAEREETGQFATAMGRDFAPADFETCTLCHLSQAGALAQSTARDVPAAFLPSDKEKQVVSLDWHGTDQGEDKCTQCHSEVYGEELAQVSITRASGQLFKLPNRYDHGKFFEGHPEYTPTDDVGDCLECHRDGDVTADSMADQPFWHGLHMAQLSPGQGLSAMELSSGEKGCLSCHLQIETAAELSGDAFAGTQGQCSECHTAEPSASAGTTATRLAVRFPHAVHVDAFKESSTMEEGCFACHEFSNGDRYSALALTTEGAQSCMQCHEGHDNTAGDVKGCILCHTADDMVYRNETIEKEWPSANTFDHFSPGHVDGSSLDPGSGGEADCYLCHDSANLAGATTITGVDIPDESQGKCRDCHVSQRQRFHWR